jgi:hypothetical protein
LTPTYHPRSPEFIGIGAQKAGTSWLHAQLRSFPGVWMPPVKEIHYFDRSIPWTQVPAPLLSTRMANPQWQQWAVNELLGRARSGQTEDLAWWTRYYLGDYDDAWYRSLFADAPLQAVTGEFSPLYALCDGAAIAHMHAVAPRARIILQLRHPVDRFWSQCQMNQERKILTNRVEDILAHFHLPRGRPRGDYAATILNFVQHYAPDDILLVFFDAITRSPARLLQDVADFLGVQAYLPAPDALARKVNAAGNDTPMPEAVRVPVAEAYAQGLQVLADVFGGYAATWQAQPAGFADSSAADGDDLPATLRLTTQHVAQLRRASERVNA